MKFFFTKKGLRFGFLKMSHFFNVTILYRRRAGGRGMKKKNDMTVEEYIAANDERRDRHQEYLEQFLSDTYDEDNDLLLKAMTKDERRGV